MDSQTPVSELLLKQRVRNRVIEYLATASSFEEQLDYERDVPIADVPAEMICGWSDFVHEENIGWYSEPVFSLDEQHEIKRFNETWKQTLNEMPNPWPRLSELNRMEHWNRLRAGAEQALHVFEKRGVFDDDVEEFPSHKPSQ